MSIPPPANNRLFVERHIYECLLLLEYAVACHYVGEYAAAIATYNGLLRQGKVPAMLIDQVIANRRFSIDAVEPPSKSPAESGQIKICVAFQDPGPELDECIESISRQDLESFTATFIDDGSSQDRSARIPLEDPRFFLLRHKTPVGPEGLGSGKHGRRSHFLRGPFPPFTSGKARRLGLRHQENRATLRICQCESGVGREVQPANRAHRLTGPGQI
jgi:hypothetical protein